MHERKTPADASALIYLAKARALEEAVAIIGQIVVPGAVWREVVEAGEQRGEPDAALIRVACDRGQVVRKVLTDAEERSAAAIGRRFRLGQGESALLAMTKPRQIVLLDDTRAVRVAGVLGLAPLTTVSLPVLGFREGVLDARQAIKLIRRLAQIVVLRADVLLRLEASLAEEER